MAIPLPPAALDYLTTIRTVTYCEVSAIALYLWDYLLTFDMEVDLVWKSEWTFMKYLFLVQRYMPFIDTCFLIPYQLLGRNIPINTCESIEVALGYLIISGVLLSELLLAFRVRAVWNRETWPTVILALCFVITWALTYFYAHEYLASLGFGPPILPTLNVCTIVKVQNDLHNAFVTILVWNFVTLIFMLIPGIRSYKSGGNSALLHVVYRDGVTYYFYLALSSTLNIIAIRTFTKPEHIFLSIQRALHAILASRVLLHIRHIVKHETEIISDGTVLSSMNYKDLSTRTSGRTL